jgi:hypothetical protein
MVAHPSLHVKSVSRYPWEIADNRRINIPH